MDKQMSSVDVTCPQISDEELDHLEDAFDLLDFWDGRDGLIDAAKVGDLLRCVGFNPTNRTVHQVGGASEMGEGHYNFDDILTIYNNTKARTNHHGDAENGDIREAFRSFDREGRGFISMAELRLMLTSRGEKLTDQEVDEILKYTDVKEDMHGAVRYEDFVSKVIEGPADWRLTSSS
ncbi:myosin, essential light chain, adductor muscle-like [Liolophura sinensis]|uniref:myosin, essential light chain, adductor muscle-like n=1 Tax=Liolophura sinensis TaxID=3198878 RepID=UPI0031584ECD